MKNSYQGYWFSCETSYSDDIGTRKGAYKYLVKHGYYDWDNS